MFDVIDRVGGTARADNFEEVDFGNFQRMVIDLFYEAGKCALVELMYDDTGG